MVTFLVILIVLLQIYTKQALHCFEKGNYVESAMYYAKTRASFEEIALKFMQVQEKTALLNFLKKRLEQVSDCSLDLRLRLMLAKLSFFLTLINFSSRLQRNAEIRTSEIQTMLKYKQSIIRKDLFEFWRFGSFDRSDFGIHNIRMPIMPTSERLNRIVRISDDIFCPKSEQIVWISALFSV